MTLPAPMDAPPMAASKLPRLLDILSKFALFSVCDLKDEKLIKKKTNLHEN